MNTLVWPGLVCLLVGLLMVWIGVVLSRAVLERKIVLAMGQVLVVIAFLMVIVGIVEDFL